MQPRIKKNVKFAYSEDPSQERIPVVNECVLVEIIKTPGKAGGIKTGFKYYTKILNIWNHPNSNTYKDVYSQESQNLEEYEESTEVRPLKPTPGDRLYQGRLGQSIRFSGGGEDLPWVDQTNKHQPSIVISNGQYQSDKSIKPTYEDINSKGSSIYLLKDHKLNIDIPNQQYSSYDKKPTNPDQYKGIQIINLSDRIVNFAKNDHILNYAQKSVGFNSDTFNIDAKKYACIESNQIYLGKQARKLSKDQKQPVMLGHKTEQFLENTIKVLDDIAISMQNAVTVDGKNIPSLNKTGLKVKTLLNNLKSQINPQGGSNLKSNKVFTE